MSEQYGYEWWRELEERNKARAADSRRAINYYQKLGAEREARENAARAARHDHREACEKAAAWLNCLLNAEQHQADLERGMSSEAAAHLERVAQIRAQYAAIKAEADRLAAVVAQAPSYP